MGKVGSRARIVLLKDSSWPKILSGLEKLHLCKFEMEIGGQKVRGTICKDLPSFWALSSSSPSSPSSPLASSRVSVLLA